MFIPNRTEKSKKPPQNGLEKKKFLQHHESGFSDLDGQAAEALLRKIQSRQIETKTVELSKIENHEYLKIRDFPDNDVIEQLVGKLRGSQILPPVILMPDQKLPESYYCIDGDLRLLAKRNQRAETAEAIVVDCTLRQGLLLRLMLNSSHAKELSKREKIRNIKRLLEDEQWKECSDREIAGYCGYYGAKVAKIRRELDILASGKNSQIRRIFRRGCAPYYMEVSKINLKRKSSSSEVDTGGLQTGDNLLSPPQKTKDKNRVANAPKLHKAELVNQKYGIQEGDVMVMYDRKNPRLFYIIYCGDSTDERFFKICSVHIKAGLLVADIPWNVDLTGGGHYRDPIAHKLDKLPNDNLSSADYKQFIHKIFSNCAPHLKPGSAFFVFFGIDEIRSVIDVTEDNLGKVEQTIVWYKWALRQNNSYFKEAHELALFGWTAKGALRYWSGEDSQKSVLEEKLLGDGEGELSRSTHPCPKPVSVIRRLIELCLEPYEVVLDAVLGSGTTLHAAAQIGRSGIGVELVPEYAALAVDRLIDHYGEDRLHYHKTTIEKLPEVLIELEKLQKSTSLKEKSK